MHYSSHRSLSNGTTALTSKSDCIGRASPNPLQMEIKSSQNKVHKRKFRSFFDDDLESTAQSDLILTIKRSNMEEENKFVNSGADYEQSNNTKTCIYRWRSSRSIEYETQQRKLSKDVTTTASLQTTSTSTALSSSQYSNHETPQSKSCGATIPSPSVPSFSHSDTMNIETEVSNLTESPSSEASDPICSDTRFRQDSVVPRDQILESVARLQEIERKRSIVRDQRFGLEQRLYNFRRAVSCPKTISEDETGNGEDSKEVVNWKYKTSNHGLSVERRGCNTELKGSLSQCPVSQTILYTGRLNAVGQPHDNNALLRFSDDQIYKGSVRNGQRHGSGTNQWPDGQTYSGEWQNDSRNGRGTHIWRDGRTVTGTWKDGHLHGRVYFRWPNGAVFDGTANMGKKEGKGVTTRPDGTVYNGNYSNGKEDGFGTLIRSDGIKYRGEFRNGLKEGYGVMLWHTRTYDGEWSRDRPHGQGRVVWSNGAVFQGQFQEGTYCGLGVYTWASGKKFVGRWKKGIKDGHGVHTWPSGKKYDGEYANGVKEGYGRMTWPDGSMYCGGFKRNRRCGRGIQTDANGAVVHCGLWKHDRPYENTEDHKVLYVECPSWLRTETNRSTLQSRVERTKEENGKDGAGRDYGALNETLFLPSLSRVAPAVVTPRSVEDAQTGDAIFPESVFEDHTDEEDIEELVEERILSSSKVHRDAVSRLSSPSTIANVFHERVTI